VAAAWQLLVLLAMGLAAGLAFGRLGVPGGDMIVGMVVGAVANALWLQVDGLPEAWRLFAQWVVGVGVGATVTRKALADFRPYALAGSLMTALLIVAGLCAGWVLARLASLDLLTAIMGTSPGGADTMMILASELGADARLVTAMHVSRMIVITLVTPVAIRALGTRAQRARAAVTCKSG
jgi:membrane AbrB-like protein